MSDKGKKKKCLTPGARYFMDTSYFQLVIFAIRLPNPIDGIPENVALELDRVLHDAAEKVLAPLFKKKKVSKP